MFFTIVPHAMDVCLLVFSDADSNRLHAMNLCLNAPHVWIFFLLKSPIIPSTH